MSFRYKDHAFGEDEPQIFLELLLEDPATNDLVIQVNSHSNTATGELCTINVLHLRYHIHSMSLLLVTKYIIIIILMQSHYINFCP